MKKYASVEEVENGFVAVLQAAEMSPEKPVFPVRFVVPKEKLSAFLYAFLSDGGTILLAEKSLVEPEPLPEPEPTSEPEPADEPEEE